MSAQAALVTRHLALAQEPVPTCDALHLARLVVDTVAIAHHARRRGTGAAAILRGRGGPIPVWGGEGARDAGEAALLNGAAAEALDYQEVLIDGRNNGHAAVVVVPTLAALAAREGVGADRLLPALRTAFVANIVLAQALGRGHRTGERGFRTTSLTAPVAAALGGAALLGFGEAAATHAVGIAAASLPVGLLAAMAAGGGGYTEDKDLSVGLSARHAVEAVDLARAGLRGPPDALAGPRGWLASYGMGDAEPGALEQDPATVELAAYAIKRFPANFGCQCAIRLALEMAPEAGEVASVVVRVKSSSATSLSTRELRSHIAARFSLPYCAASALVRRRCALADFEPDALGDPAVLALMDRVTLEGDEAMEVRHRADGVFPAELSLTDGDGRTVRRRLDHPWEGLSDAEARAALAEKLRALLPPRAAERVLAPLAHGEAETAVAAALDMDGQRDGEDDG